MAGRARHLPRVHADGAVRFSRQARASTAVAAMAATRSSPTTGARAWVAVDISAAVEIASQNVAERPGVDGRPGRSVSNCRSARGTFEAMYSVGVLHHTPDARRGVQGDAAVGQAGGIFFRYSSTARAIACSTASNRGPARMDRERRRTATTWRFSQVLTGAGEGARQDSLHRPDAVSDGAARCCSFSPRSAQQLRSLQCRVHQLPTGRKKSGAGTKAGMMWRFATPGVANESIYAPREQTCNTVRLIL